MSGTREKFNAVFFAAIMVLSMVAFGTAFAGSAAAVASTPAPSAENIDLTEGTVTQNITFTLENGTDYADSGTATSATTIDVNEPGAGLSISGVTLDNATAVGGSAGGTQYAGTQVTDNSDTANDDIIVNVNESQLADGDANTIDIELTATYDAGQVATGVNFSVASNGGTLSAPSEVDTNNFDVQGLAIDSVEPSDATSVINQGTDELYNVTVENTGENSVDQTVGVDVANAGGSDTAQSGSVAPGSTTEVSGLNPSTSNLALGATEDVTVTTDNDQLVGEVDVRSSDNVFISGEITDQQNLQNIDSDVVDRLELTITETQASNPDREIVSNVPLGDLDTLAGSNPYVDSASIINGQPDQYTIELATFGADNQYAFEVVDPDGQFGTFDGDTETLSPNQNDDQAIRVNRLEDADRLTVLDDGELDRIEGDIGSGDVPIDPAPSSLESTSADVDATVTLDTFTETADNTDEGTNIGELAPFANEDGEVDVTVANVDDATFQGNVNVDPDPADTDENGTSSVDVNLDFAGAGVTPSDVSETVNVDLEFNASTNASASDTVTVSFVPDIGETATISGDVNELDIPESAISAQSNAEPIEDLQVHAVNKETMLESTAALDDAAGLEDVTGDTFEGATINDQSSDQVSIAKDTQFRVVTFEDGDEVVQDPRSDYFVTTTDDVDVRQNTSSIGFDVESAAETVIDLHFLEEGEYQVQQRVGVDTTGDGEFDNQTYVNATLDEQPATLGAADGTAQGSPDDLFDVTQDVTYEAQQDRYENDTIIPTDTTSSDGGFTLLNLQTGVDYFVIAGAGDPGPADVSGNQIGFANFGGVDIVENTVPNAEPQSSQQSVDLQVQEFTPEVDLVYDLDVTVEDPDTGDFVKSVDIPTGEDVEVQVEAFVGEAGDDREDFEEANGVDVDIGLTTPGAGDVDPETVTITDGVGTTTFTGDDRTGGDTNVTATTTNATDREGEAFSTDAGEEAQIDVFQDAQITGVVRDDVGDSPIPNANVTVFEYDYVDEEVGDLITNKDANDDGSFTFTGTDGIRSEASYFVEAEFENETGFNSLEDISGGSTNADIVIEGVEAPEGFEIEDGSLQAPAEAAPGDEIEVSANISNTAGEQASSDVTFVFDGSDVTSQEITLDPGETDTVSFSPTVPDVADGDYEHGIETDIDDATATITVQGAAESPVDGVTQEQFDAVLPNGTDTGLTELRASVSDWSEDRDTVDGVAMSLSELRSIINYWIS